MSVETAEIVAQFVSRAGSGSPEAHGAKTEKTGKFIPGLVRIFGSPA